MVILKLIKIGRKWEAHIGDDSEPTKDKFVAVGDSMFKALESLLIMIVVPPSLPIRLEFRLVEDGFICDYKNHEAFGSKKEIALAGIVEMTYNDLG